MLAIIAVRHNCHIPACQRLHGARFPLDARFPEPPRDRLYHCSAAQHHPLPSKDIVDHGLFLDSVVGAGRRANRALTPARQGYSRE